MCHNDVFELFTLFLHIWNLIYKKDQNENLKAFLVESIFKKQNIIIHCFADDIQVYLLMKLRYTLLTECSF